jgi:hypothetical protein
VGRELSSHIYLGIGRPFVELWMETVNKYIRIAVWAFIISILASGVGIVARVYGAENYKTLSHQYNLVYADLLVKKLKIIHKGQPIILYLKDGSEVSGIYKGYVSYDDTLWVKREGHWFADGYGIMELQDIVVSMEGKV